MALPLANPPQFTLFNDLKAFRTSWRIRCKILHCWKQFGKKSGHTLELILADETGARLGAVIKKDHVTRFKNSVAAGEWKIIHNFQVSKDSSQYRGGDFPYKITFLYMTTVGPSDLAVDSQFIRLATFDGILAGNYDLNVLTDVLGQVVSVGDVGDIEVRGKINRKLDFELRDATGVVLPCAFWGTFVDSLSKCYAESPDGIIYLLIRFAKLNLWNDVRSVSNAFDASVMFVNPDLPEIEAFRTLPPLTLKKPKDNLLVGGEDDWLQYPRKSVMELLDTREVSRCRVVVSIWAIDTDWGWYYFGCKQCNRKTFPTDPIKIEDVKTKQIPNFWCETCRAYTKAVSPRFKLHLQVMDPTGETKCMLFDSFAKKVVGQTASDLLGDVFGEIEDPEAVPLALKNLIGKTFQFGLIVEKDNIYSGNDTFKVGHVKSSSKDELASTDLLAIEVSDMMTYSSDQVQLTLTNSSEYNDCTESTPSSKRSEPDGTLGEDQSSTNKRHCDETKSRVIGSKTVLDGEASGELNDDKKDETFMAKIDTVAYEEIKKDT